MLMGFSILIKVFNFRFLITSFKKITTCTLNIKNLNISTIPETTCTQIVQSLKKTLLKNMLHIFQSGKENIESKFNKEIFSNKSVLLVLY
jgi:hypothetical protein